MSSPHRSLLLSLVLSLSGCTAETPPVEPPPPPLPLSPPIGAARTPLVIVTLDTTRADHLGAWGYAAARTPNLDALAARGTRFARAYAPVPLTIPSHSTLFTGLLPPHHGVHTNGDARLSEEAVTLAERLQAAGYQTHAAVGAYVTQAHWGFGQGFDGYDDDLGLPTDRLSWRAERRADAVVDDALAALAGGADMLWVHLFDAHAPYDPPAEFVLEGALPYDSEIAFVDAQVGRLLAALPPETLIVVSGDHGEAFGEGGEEEHGLLTTDATLHVPLILAGPGVAAGAVVERPVSLADVTPTLLRLLDVAPDPDEAFDGIDLFSASTERSGVYSEAMQGAYLFGWAPLRRWRGAAGALLRANRDVVEGEPPEDAGTRLDEMAPWTPPWEVGPLTLDPAQVEQLQALGYIAPTMEGGAVMGDGLDPWEGIAVMKELRTLRTRPPAEQEATLRAFLETQPGMRDARFRLGLLLANQGRLEEAISQTEEAYRISADSTTAVMTASLWMQSGVPGEALQWFHEALELDPRSLDARAGEVEALIALGLLDEARATASLYLEQAPDHGRMMLAAAMLALAADDPVDAWREPITTLALRRPYEPRALQVAAELNHRAGDAEQATALLQEELRWRPHNTAARLELAALFREQQRLVDVVKTIRPLLAIQPEEPQWHAITAEAYLAMGRADRAAPHLDACKGHPACPTPDALPPPVP